MPDATADPVLLTLARNEMEAGMLVNRLAEHDITAHMVGELTAGLRAEAPGDVQILVQRDDVESARAVLAEWRSESIEYDWPEFPDDATEPSD